MSNIGKNDSKYSTYVFIWYITYKEIMSVKYEIQQYTKYKVTMYSIYISARTFKLLHTTPRYLTDKSLQVADRQIRFLSLRRKVGGPQLWCYYGMLGC